MLLLLVKLKLLVACLTDASPEACDDANEAPPAGDAATPVDRKPLTAVTTAELFVQRREKIAELKQRIAAACSAICENPEENVSHV